MILSFADPVASDLDDSDAFHLTMIKPGDLGDGDGFHLTTIKPWFYLYRPSHR